MVVVRVLRREGALHSHECPRGVWRVWVWDGVFVCLFFETTAESASSSSTAGVTIEESSAAAAAVTMAEADHRPIAPSPVSSSDDESEVEAGQV